MFRRAVLVGFTASIAVLGGAVVPATVSAAPAPQPGGPAPAHGSADTAARADRDGDHVSDDFEAELAAARPGDKLRVIVTGPASAASQRAVGAFLVRHELTLIDGYAATMTAAQARALIRQPALRRIERDGRMYALDDATNRDFGATQARLDHPGVDGAGVGVCVVDTGIDPGHEQIAPRTVGFVDYVNGRTTAYDDHGHGTHVAAIAAGDGTGGALADDFVGVAPGASLYGAKVLDASGYGDDSDVVAGIQWCHAQPGVRVISMSLGGGGGDGTDAGSLAVNQATAGGDVVVVAAGNSGDAPGTVNAPGVATGAITVGAASDHSAPVGTDRHDDGIWLAAFSSRGPTADGRIKPDVVAPGVTVRSADAGTSAGYATFSGTSMATPYVAGAVALALDADPTATPTEVRAALTATAADRGRTGLDNEWGAGIVDVRAFVDAVAGASTPRQTAFPSWERRTGTVPSNGSVDVPIAVGADGLGVPLAVTVTLTSGALACDVYCQIGFSAGEWTPDLDVELRDPSGNLVADSQCALSGVSCTTGRQETVAIRPQVAGTYVLRVYAWPGGDGAGGSFLLDISRGPLGSGATEPPPPPADLAPVADAGPDRSYRINRQTKQAAFNLDGSSSSDPENGTLTYAWSLGTQTVGTTAVLAQSRSVGTYTYTLVVTDPSGLSDADTVTIKVRR